MISIIVYGRNDNYGYNLHKRAAISLNCLAEVLREAEDELIFVDYNTPDDLPTFPEAIADTLTARTRSVLRILRARPGIHARYAGKTRLLALEAVARNIGVRRSNPANRWVLSTNTDIVLVLRRARDLADLAADLPSGFYHTARFEIPESLWESFDRTKPQRIIEEVRALGRSARLNEVVYGSDMILFDGPGDFQLVERAALFAIDGFDERMLRAWHVDSNLAKRLTLRCGPVGSLLDEVYCYHCDHTRQATPAHTRSNVGNDMNLFVDAITRAELPEQRQSWGSDGDAIEEIRLSQTGTAGYRAALQTVLPPLAGEFTEAFYRPDTFNRYEYDPQHVLPFLADLLSCAPRETRLAWCGTRPDMFQLLCAVWRELGFRRPIALHPSAARFLGGPPNDAEMVGLESWLTEADVFAFEFGLPSGAAAKAPGECSDDGPTLEAVAVVESALLAAVAHERRRRAAASDLLPRRFIGVNFIHNRLEGVFGAHITAALTPFGSHLRHGFLVAERNLDPETTRRILIGHALGRPEPITPAELAFAEGVFAPLLNGGSLTPGQVRRAACYASLGQAFLATALGRRHDPMLADRAARASAELERLRPSARFSAELGIGVDEPPYAPAVGRPLSRFAGDEDWDDPSWSSLSDAYATDPEANAGYRRDAWRWDQVHLLYGLDRLGITQGEPRVLVVAAMPDAAIAALSRRARRVELFGLNPEVPGEPMAARVFWCNGAAYIPEALEILPGGTRIDALDCGAYDAVIFPHGAMFGGGLTIAIAWMRAAEALLRPGGVLAFKAEIAAGPHPHPNHFDVRAVTGDGLAAQLERCTRFTVPGGFDALLSRATVDKLRPETGWIAEEAYLLFHDNGRILIPSYWFLEKHEPVAEPQWDQLRQWVERRWLGEQLPGLLTGAAGTRDEGGRILGLAERQGYVFFGPYLPVAAGRYRAVLHLRPQDAGTSNASRATLDAAVDQTVIAAKHITDPDLTSGTISLEFDVDHPTSHAGPSPLLEIRLDSPWGGLAVTVESVELELREPYRLGDWPELPAAGSAPIAATGVSSVPEQLLAVPVGEGDVDRQIQRLIKVTDEAPGESRTAAAVPAWSFDKREVDPVMTGAPSLPFPRRLNAAARPLSRTMADDDWEDSSWARFLDPMSRADGRPRDQGGWERTHLLYGLDRCGKLSGSARVLVGATMPDEVIGLLSEYADRVEVVCLRSGSSKGEAEARLFWSNGGLYARDRLIVHDGTAGDLEDAAYDAVVFPHGAICCGGVAGMPRLMEKAEQLLAPEGVLAFKVDVLAGNQPDPDNLDAGLFVDEGFVHRIETDTGFTVDGGFDARFPWENGSAASITRADNVNSVAPAPDDRGRLAVPSLWFLRKRGPAPGGGWDRIEEWVVRRLLGEQLHNLQLGPAGRRDALGHIVTNGAEQGCIFFGPYLALPGGRYEAVVAIEPLMGEKRGRLVLDVAAGGRRLRRRDVSLAEGIGVVATLPFELPSPSVGRVERVEIRAWSNGCPAVFSACQLRASEA